MQQIGVSAIHPNAPEFLSAAALFTQSVDLNSAIARLNTMWRIGADPQWASVDIPSSAESSSSISPAPDNSKRDASSLDSSDKSAAHTLATQKYPTGQLMHFSVQGVQVMLSHVNQPLTPEKGTLPKHSHYVAVTLYSPASKNQPHSAASSSSASHATPDSATAPNPSAPRPEIERRRHALTAHIILTQLAHALLQAPGAIGLYRAELGVVQPPEMLNELAPLLEQGTIPLPLWVNIRIQTHDLTVGRTLGLALFGHLDLEVVESTHGSESVYAELANIATYIMTSDNYLLPGQTIGVSDGEQIPVTQSLSPLDQSPVIRIMY